MLTHTQRYRLSLTAVINPRLVYGELRPIQANVILHQEVFSVDHSLQIFYFS